MTQEAALSLLRTVPLLTGVNDNGLVSLLKEGALRLYPTGATVFVELEPGDSLLFVLQGSAHVTIGVDGEGAGTRVALAGPGDVLGEVTVLTGELRSATVTAAEPLETLIISRSSFEKLLARFPSVAVHVHRLLAARLRDTEQAIDRLVNPSTRPEAPAARPVLGGVRQGYRELVKGHGEDLAFLMLVSFAANLLLTRAVIALVRLLGFSLSGVLKATYLTGLVLLCVSAVSALSVRRPGLLRVLAGLFGAGVAMLLNGMSALMAFDIFYKQDWTLDPTFPFSIESLYDRSESTVLLLSAAAILVQAAFLRRFYMRLVYELIARIYGKRTSG